MLLWDYTPPLQGIISTQRPFEDGHYTVSVFCKLSTFWYESKKFAAPLPARAPWWNTLYSTSKALYPFNGRVDLKGGYFQTSLSGRCRKIWMIHESICPCVNVVLIENGAFYSSVMLRLLPVWFYPSRHTAAFTWKHLERGDMRSYAAWLQWGHLKPGCCKARAFTSPKVEFLSQGSSVVFCWCRHL